MPLKSKNTGAVPYVHEELVHNLESPSEIVKVLVDIFKPQSIVDVGCGIGTFVKAFKLAGVRDVTGVDGSWVNRQLLANYMDSREFIEADLQRPLVLNRKFDLLVSLEVAEHLESKYAEQFVKNLCNHSDIIVFSAAIPGQPGQNHINVQWIDYWEKYFNDNGFVVKDLLRPVFWDNSRIFYWYRQNMFLAVKKGVEIDEKAFMKYHSGKIMKAVHPRLLERYVEMLGDLREGKHEAGYYWKLFIQSLKNKIFRKKVHQSDN